MKTTTTETPTKEKMMAAAQELMLSKGFVATTVDEICEASGVTKGSFFHYFKNKEDLGLQLIDRFSKGAGQMMEEALSELGADPLERVYGYIDFFIKMSRNPEMKGCLVVLFPHIGQR